MAIDDLDSLLAADPQLHRDGKGGLTSWSLPKDVLRFINSKLRPGLETLETGIGVSTLVFTLGGARHTSIAHHPDEVQNVARYCSEQNISTDNLTLINDRSENALPRIMDDGPLDLVLIDGRHAFPTPIVDWYYTVIRLRVGGMMIVDDLALKTGQILAEFMDVDHRFERCASFANTAAFIKLEDEIEIGEFHFQPWMTSE